MNDQDDFELKRALNSLPRTIEPPEDLWPEIRGRLAPRAAIRRSWWSGPSLRIAAALALLAVSAGVLLSLREHRTEWLVADLAGAPLVGDAAVDAERTFPVGDVLRTDDSSRAIVQVAAIGHVEVEPNTELRLVEARSTAHRLDLRRGTIHARINAPPRLFIVETPTAVAVDLGCAYTLEVDSAGNSFIHVTLGWVSWESEGREALVPAGNRAETRFGRGIGMPYSDDAPAALRRALLAFDFEQGGDSALVEVLRVARARDAITLWHLLSRVESGRRVAVYERLSELVPPPEGVTRDAVLRLDQMALKLWWEELPSSLPIIPSWSRTIWLWWLKLVG
jgi:hypothetical protein